MFDQFRQAKKPWLRRTSFGAHGSTTELLQELHASFTEYGCSTVAAIGAAEHIFSQDSAKAVIIRSAKEAIETLRQAQKTTSSIGDEEPKPGMKIVLNTVRKTYVNKLQRLRKDIRGEVEQQTIGKTRLQNREGYSNTQEEKDDVSQEEKDKVQGDREEIIRRQEIIDNLVDRESVLEEKINNHDFEIADIQQVIRQCIAISSQIASMEKAKRHSADNSRKSPEDI